MFLDPDSLHDAEISATRPQIRVMLHIIQYACVKAGLGPGHIMLDGDSALPRKGPQQPLPTFRPMSIVAKRSPISATCELLFRTVLTLLNPVLNNSVQKLQSRQTERRHTVGSPESGVREGTQNYMKLLSHIK